MSVTSEVNYSWGKTNMWQQNKFPANRLKILWPTVNAPASNKNVWLTNETEYEKCHLSACIALCKTFYTSKPEA